MINSTDVAAVLGILAFGFALDSLADFLDLKWLRDKRFAPGIDALYSPAELERAVSYHQNWKFFSVLRRTCGAVVFLIFFTLGGFGAVDTLAREFSPWAPLTGVFFIAFLLLLRGVFELPFNAYGTFVIEERFGFNRTSVSTFMKDLFKGIFLSALLGAPLFALVVWFFERTGSSGWLPAWLALSVFQLVLAFLAPALLLPLFNRFEPLPEGELKSSIERFCEKTGFQVAGVYQMDGSKRTTKANAFFTGFGRLRKLVLYDTLITKLSQDELLGVLAHEIGHFREKHIHKFVTLSLASTGLLLFIFSFFIGSPALSRAFGVTEPSVHATLVFLAMLYGPLGRMLGTGINALSRRFEFTADAFSARTFGDPGALASALSKISTDSLANPAPHPLRVALDYSHPPVVERISALKSQLS